MKVKLTLSYDGGAFAGFQVQKNADSVQAALCRALATVFREEVSVTGCSRTDAGVHARRYVCHAVPKTAEAMPKDLTKSLNALLPDAIGVLSAEPVGDDFHARYSVKQKTYRYYVLMRKARDPLLRGRVTHIPQALDFDAMQDAAKALCGTHDFRAFMSSGGKEGDTVRTVTDAAWVCAGDDLWYFTVTADGFLYRMVRNMVGTLCEIGMGKEHDIAAILCSRDRKNAGRCAPPEGLYLWQVDYE